jgi:ceramide glucosyltransferase
MDRHMWILPTFCAFALFVHVMTLAIVAYRHFRRPRRSEILAAAPPISIIRPVCGLENNLESTLRSGLALDYPRYETIFCVARANDPALPLVRRLVDEYAARHGADARVLVGDDPISINPKLNNVLKGWRAARHDWIVMADSNVAMPRDYLQRLLGRWSGDAGMVCSPPLGTAPESFAADLECAFLDSFQGRFQLAADTFGMGFAQGKTMFTRRDILDRAGGIETLAREVAEDAAATKAVRGQGLEVRLVDRLIPQPLGRRTFAEVWRRQVRWARLRRASFPLQFSAELVAGGLPPIAALSVGAALDLWPGTFIPLYAAVWYGAELALIGAVKWPLSSRMPLALILRDTLLPVLFVAALTGSAFTWRGNAMAVATRHPHASARRERLSRVRHSLVKRAEAIRAYAAANRRR